MSKNSIRMLFACIAASLSIAVQADDVIEQIKQRQQEAVTEQQSAERNESSKNALIALLRQKGNSYLENMYLTLRSEGIKFDDPSATLNEFNSEATMGGGLNYSIKSTKYDSQILFIDGWKTQAEASLDKTRPSVVAVVKPSGVHDIVTLNFLFHPFDADASGTPTDRCKVQVELRRINYATEVTYILGDFPCASMVDGTALKPLADAFAGWIGAALGQVAQQHVENAPPISMNDQDAYWNQADEVIAQSFRSNYKYWAKGNEKCIVTFKLTISIDRSGLIQYVPSRNELIRDTYNEDFGQETEYVFRRIGSFHLNVPYGMPMMDRGFERSIAVRAFIPFPETKRFLGQAIGHDYDSECAAIKHMVQLEYRPSHAVAEESR